VWGEYVEEAGMGGGEVHIIHIRPRKTIWSHCSQRIRLLELHSMGYDQCQKLESVTVCILWGIQSKPFSNVDFIIRVKISASNYLPNAKNLTMRGLLNTLY
jgi:hypothetical protein